MNEAQSSQRSIGAMFGAAARGTFLDLPKASVAEAARATLAVVGAPAAFLATGLAELNGWFLGLACGTFFAVGPGLAAAILLASAILMVFMPKYRYNVGHVEQAAGTPAAQTA